MMGSRTPMSSVKFFGNAIRTSGKEIADRFAHFIETPRYALRLIRKRRGYLRWWLVLNGSVMRPAAKRGIRMAGQALVTHMTLR